MGFYKLDPEVAGGWGSNTEFTRVSGEPLQVHKLHYQFDGWLGDALLESNACFIVTDELAAEIQNQKLSGYELKPVDISTSETFQELYPNRKIPLFKWLHINGKARVDDFGMDFDGRLVVSNHALNVLQTKQLSNCDVSVFD